MLERAKSLIDEDPDECYRICQTYLSEHPDSHVAYTLSGVVNYRAERYGAALAFFNAALALNPNQAELHNWVGTVWHELKEPGRARDYLRRALELKKNPLYMTGIGATYTEEGNHQEAIKWARKAQAIEPDLIHAKQVLAFAQLALGDWENGWQNYRANLGGRFRKKLSFDNAPDWDGGPVNRLVVYGEQGLGDEIMFASCIGDIKADDLVIECDPRLEGLYRRSFPSAEVHGTRRQDRDWNVTCDAQVAVGDLPAFFRPTRESCPRKPYLTADPERRMMWRALFKSWGKPVIGLTWTGGKQASQYTKRMMGLESLRPLIETTDAVFVSLQYKDPREEIEASGLPVRHFSALLSDDYDDTAALVAELDSVMGIHTTAHHLAGALGVPGTVFVPDAPMWNYATGDRLPWYAEQVFFRQRKSEKWADCVRRFMSVRQPVLEAA